VLQHSPKHLFANATAEAINPASDGKHDKSPHCGIIRTKFIVSFDFKILTQFSSSSPANKKKIPQKSTGTPQLQQ
jgi:hypothetical protein